MEAENTHKVGNKSGAADRIYKQFDLGRETYVDASVKGDILQDGPVMSRETFDKFSDADPTQGKVFLEWMIFQAGGGADTYNMALTEWQGDQEEEDYQNIYEKWRDDQNIRYDIWVKKNEGKTFDDWKATGHPEGGAISDIEDLPGFIQSIPVMVKEFSRLQYTFLAMCGINDLGEKVSEENSYEDSQIMWEAAMPCARRAHMYGDQDSAVSMKYGFYRNWDDAPKDLYEKILETVQSFISNKAKLDQILKANVANEKWNTANPEETPRTIRDIPSFDEIERSIGQFSVNNDIITYSGSYKNLRDLEEAVLMMSKVEFKSSVQKDVMYSDIDGKSTSNTPIYRDDRLTVWVPLTVAASIRRGFTDWCVANQSNIDGYIRSGNPSEHRSYWEAYTSKKGHKLVFATFNFKRAGVAKITKSGNRTPTIDLDKINASIGWNSLDDLGDNYENIEFWTRHYTETTSIDAIRVAMSKHSSATLESFNKGLEAVRKWGKVFDPALLVADFKTKHMRIR